MVSTVLWDHSRVDDYLFGLAGCSSCVGDDRTFSHAHLFSVIWLSVCSSTTIISVCWWCWWPYALAFYLLTAVKRQNIPSSEALIPTSEMDDLGSRTASYYNPAANPLITCTQCSHQHIAIALRWLFLSVPLWKIIARWNCCVWI